MNFPYVRLALGVVVGISLASCSLISSDVTNFDLTLPDKKFTIDASGWQVTQMEADTVTGMTCTSSTLCNSAVVRACPMGCSGSCNATLTCDLSLDISRSQSIDLVAEKPELKSINDEPVIKVTVDSVTYEVTSNTLNVDTPEITVYVAPTSVLQRTDPQAKAIGTIDPVPAGWVTSGPQTITFTAAGKLELVNLMNTFKTPFNVLEGSSLLVTKGQTVPTGKLDAVVHIKGHAGL